MTKLNRLVYSAMVLQLVDDDTLAKFGAKVQESKELQEFIASQVEAWAAQQASHG